MVKGNLEWYSENLWNQSTSSVRVLTNQNGDIKQQNMRSSLRIMGLAESGGPRNQVGSASRPSFWPRRHSLVQSSVYQNESNEVFRLPGDVLIFFSKNCCKNFILQDVRKPPAMQTAKPIEAIVILKPKRGLMMWAEVYRGCDRVRGMSQWQAWCPWLENLRIGFTARNIFYQGVWLLEGH